MQNIYDIDLNTITNSFGITHLYSNKPEKYKNFDKCFGFGYPIETVNMLSQDMKIEFNGFNDDCKIEFIKGIYENCDGKTLGDTCIFPIPKLLNYLKADILKFIDIPFIEKNDIIIFQSHNALDFLSKLYDRNYIFRGNNFKDYVKFLKYSENTLPMCRFIKTDKKAVIPTKVRASDAGYDLTVIKEVKRLGKNTVLYDTCIKVSPSFGYYTQVVPRSSISKSGYMLSNSIGIIDSGYTGNIMISLTKVDDSFPDLVLPFKCAQLLLVKHTHYLMDEMDSEYLVNTGRSVGGFGSTDV